MADINYYKDLLEKSYNLILTGAPGTGKTYLAKEIAKAMGATESNGNQGFVQFHPSYDYTDFVEGLRPTKPNKDGNIGFERMDGVFKAFCKRALNHSNLEQQTVPTNNNSIVTITENDIKREFEQLVTDISSKEVTSIKQKNGKQRNNLRITDRGLISWNQVRNPEKEAVDTISVEKVLQMFELYQNKESLQKAKLFNTNNKGQPERKKKAPSGDNSMCWAVLNYIYEKIDRQKDGIPKVQTNNKIEITQKKEDSKSFVFIIDEINRGEISKIFGELFFSIDPSYRGEKEKVQTQYQNLVTEKDKEGNDDPFFKGFFVPENVYIIGTMNDIDRSVESFDFAMRRRFTWKEITAEQSAENMKLSEATKNKMKLLNEAISKIEGLNSSYHIGGAYFLDKDGKERADYDEIWKLRLRPLLFEYLRGMPDTDKELKKLENAYNGQ
jgi:5-methylcytosine-specific restriction endonuclease McrBC GTP-binding regulatory subunit McrB